MMTRPSLGPRRLAGAAVRSAGRSPPLHLASFAHDERLEHNAARDAAIVGDLLESFERLGGQRDLE